MKIRYVFLLFIVAALLGLVAGCDKESSTGPSSSIDAGLVGAWYNESENDGMEILSDGTLKPLVVDNNGKLAYEDIGTTSIKFTKASDGAFTAEQKGTVSGKDTTIVTTGKYFLTNSNNNLKIITETEGGRPSVDTLQYVKKNVGDVVKGGTSTGLTSSKTTISVAAGSSTTATISGGTPPYHVSTGSNSSIATANISGTSLIVVGISAGTTSVTVSDASSPAKTVTIPITVTPGGTTTSAITFTMDGKQYTPIFTMTELSSDTLMVYGSVSLTWSISLWVKRTVGTHAIDEGQNWISITDDSVGTYKVYSAKSGNIIVTSISGNNTKGTFDVMVLDLITPNMKRVTGVFDATFN